MKYLYFNGVLLLISMICISCVPFEKKQHKIKIREASIFIEDFLKDTNYHNVDSVKVQNIKNTFIKEGLVYYNDASCSLCLYGLLLFIEGANTSNCDHKYNCQFVVL
jgi:hypothetical protein